MKIIRENFLFAELGVFAPWREAFLIRGSSISRLFAQAAKVSSYSNVVQDATWEMPAAENKLIDRFAQMKKRSDSDIL